MNTATDPVILDLEPIDKPAEHASAQLPALTDQSPAAIMTRALDRGATPEQIGQMMDLQERWEKREAEKAFNKAFAAFRGEDLQVLKDKGRTNGPLQGQKYATLHAFVKATKQALSKHGLAVRWDVTKDTAEWIEVTCVLKHEQGHFETVSMGGPPDNGPARNVLQARHSTVSYLERYTLKAICGLAEEDDDDDGNGGARDSLLSTWTDLVNGAETPEALNKVSKDGAHAFTKARDVEGYRHFASEVSRRKKELAEGK
jgi:hypothetical protein